MTLSLCLVLFILRILASFKHVLTFTWDWVLRLSMWFWNLFYKKFIYFIYNFVFDVPCLISCTITLSFSNWCERMHNEDFQSCLRHKEHTKSFPNMIAFLIWAWDTKENKLTPKNSSVCCSKRINNFQQTSLRHFFSPFIFFIFNLQNLHAFSSTECHENFPIVFRSKFTISLVLRVLKKILFFFN